MENKQYWDKFKRPPETAMKSIGGGRLRGMTDINPQWRLQVVTEMFGPVGKGWTYSIDRLWNEDGTDGEVMAFALVSVKYKDSDGWSEPIPGIGGSMMTAKESKGMYNSDEAYKMAVTDALSVAFKALGVGADIYLGRFDGKYWRDDDSSVAKSYEAEIKAITEAKSLDELKSVFTAAWGMTTGDVAGQKLITEAKDKRKRELA